MAALMQGNGHQVQGEICPTLTKVQCDSACFPVDPIGLPYPIATRPSECASWCLTFSLAPDLVTSNAPYLVVQHQAFKYLQYKILTSLGQFILTYVIAGPCLFGKR